ncbi:hypothetical protein SteCoe_1146 [Stentor coeruleus]|uniref:Kinesin-like protein n=1 Tax=Stentor coeruleus TaxID=5963 RepID=A0A1R2D2D5_9CILI|nr:hypothetical protein SteCoe_1146 [Stentor coeruleus]
MADKSLTPSKTSLATTLYQTDERDSLKKPIKVACRFRPLGLNFDQNQAHIEFSRDQKTLSLKPEGDSTPYLSFTFDRIFLPQDSQKQIYEEIGKPIIDSVFEGFNGTVLAYGQTSSGKTHTMIGPNINDTIHKGLIPRMIKTLFEQIKEADPTLEFAVKVAYCEIYLEKIRDLLYAGKVNLKIAEDKSRGIYIKDLSDVYVTSENEVFSLLSLGNSHREVGATNMNEESSRSHAIFMITLSQTSTADLSIKTGKLYLVDLAGSEKLAKSLAEGKRLDETKNINKSLSALGNVICALTNTKSTHIPYRDSKLTRVLSESLGGNSKTSLIITCSLAASNEAETISTLRFGTRAKAVNNKPIVNKELSIAELKLLLAQANETIAQKDEQISWLEGKICKSEGCDREQLVVERENADIGNLRSFEKEKAQYQNEVIEGLRREVDGYKVKVEILTRENENLNCKVLNLIEYLHEAEEKAIDLNEYSDKLQTKTEDHEKQILCLLDTNKNLDRKIEEMQAYFKSNSLSSSSQQNSLISSTIQTSSQAKVFSLEKNLEQLTLMYQILANKYSTAKTDLGIYEKKLLRKNDRISHLEKALKKSIEQANQYKYKLENIPKEKNDERNNMSNHGLHPKIRKMIRGGSIGTVNILCPYSRNTE